MFSVRNNFSSIVLEHELAAMIPFYLGNSMKNVIFLNVYMIYKL